MSKSPPLSIGCIPLLAHIAYINCQHREDRRQQVEHEFSRMGIPASNVHRIDAEYRPDNGRLGAALSHLKAVQTAKDLKWPTVLIVEDDFAWKPEVTPEMLVDLLQVNTFVAARLDWDVLLLATNLYLHEPLGSGADPTGTLPNRPLRRVLCGITATAYLVQARYYDALITSFSESVQKIESGQTDGFECVDMHWQYLQRPDRWWAAQLGIQRPCFSDIQNAEVDYCSTEGDAERW